MAVQTVTAWHLIQVNTSRNIDKFYRCYALPDGTEVRQYGRNRTVGKFRVKFWPTQALAENSALKQVGKKGSEGYVSGTGNPSSRLVFELDMVAWARWRNHSDGGQDEALRLLDKRANRTLELLHSPGVGNPGALALQPFESEPPETTIAIPRPGRPFVPVAIEEFRERASAALTLAAKHSPDAYTEYARLRSEWVEIEEQIDSARSLLDTLEELIALTE